MDIKVDRRDYTTNSQDYFFKAGEDEWEFNYSLFSYPSEKDRILGSVDEALEIQRTYPNEFASFKGSTKSVRETIYSVKGEVDLRFGGNLGVSPAIENFNMLEDKFKEQIFSDLSLFSIEARTLLKKGLEVYEIIKTK